MTKVEITWIDAYAPLPDGWEKTKKGIGNCKNVLVCKTVGWLLKRTKKAVIICHTYNPQMTLGRLHIPIGCIKKIKKL